MKRSAFVALIALVAFIAACEKAPPPPAEKAPAPPVAAAPAAEVVTPPTAAILHPDPAKLKTAGPDSFVVHAVTSRGEFDVKVRRAWSPKGADRFYYLVSNNYFDGVRFFRVIAGFMAQFGAHGDTAVVHQWDKLTIDDEAVKHSNKRGTLTFAKTSAPNSRSTEFFINFADNGQLDAGGFAPIGEVTNGMNVVDSLYSGYGEGADMGGRGPLQGTMAAQGNAYLKRDFPKLDYFVSARVSQEWKKSK
jgi:peptidyl-prolyl cis-trans isomerase A (cyclophilin A)